MGADLEVLARVLVYMGRADNAVAVDPGRERNRTMDYGLGTDDRFGDLARRLVHHLVVVSLQFDPDPLFFHAAFSLISRYSTVTCSIRLFGDFGDGACSHGAATFSDSEP